jgi:hypothetical protein
MASRKWRWRKTSSAGIGSDEQAVQSGEKIAEALTVSAVIYGSSLAAGQDQTV